MTRNAKGHIVAIRFGHSIAMHFIYDSDSDEEALKEMLFNLTPRDREEADEIRVSAWHEMTIVPNGRFKS